MSDSRVWLVTGTSSGIGQATVREAIADGDRVAAITRKASSVSALTEAYSSDKLFVVEHDVGNPSDSVEGLFEKVHKHFGRIDVIINNAGYGLNSVVEGTTDEEARNQFEVNFWGAVRISCEAVKYFREHNTPAGRIFNVSSVCGFRATPTLVYYSASKSALDAFSEGLHKELLPEWNIKVVTIQPGGVRTEWAKSNMVDRPLPPAYDAPDGPANEVRGLYKNTKATSDPIKLGRALINISKEPNPPLRLPLGSDSQYLVQVKLDEIKKELDEWDGLALSTVADDADPLLYKNMRTILVDKS